MVVALALALGACGEEAKVPSAASAPSTISGWTTYGASLDRNFYNASETHLTRQNVATLQPKWLFRTAAVVTASPTVGYIDVPAEGRIKVVFVTSWDANLYALRASNGSRLWQFAMKPQPGASYPESSSAALAIVGGEARVFVAGGMTMYSLAAANGTLRWQFDAGSGCTTCTPRTERNEIESSPAVVDGLVFFGMDTNDQGGKGGAYAVDALDGHMAWFFDLESGATCRPRADERIRRFDGYHSAAELGLPSDFFATRPGCNFDRSGTQCGNVWSSFSVDTQRRMIFTASSNCDTDDDPETPIPGPTMPPYDEAVFALRFDGTPVWVWRPREIDLDDLSWGALPNLFSIDVAGTKRDVLGIGNKDGTYYVLDREGTNQASGRVEPYWQRKVVPGGAIGGIIASAAVTPERILFTTAIGLSLEMPQKPAAWSLNLADGEVLWSDRSAAPSYSPTTAIPGVTFMGSLFGGMTARDAASGRLLRSFPPIGPVASAATPFEGEIFFGAGVGDRGGNPEGDAYQTSLSPSQISAYCLPDAADCPTELCDDGDVCTNDFHGPGGCQTEAAPDGIPCPVLEAPTGACQLGHCVLR